MTDIQDLIFIWTIPVVALIGVGYKLYKNHYKTEDSINDDSRVFNDFYDLIKDKKR